MVGVPSISSSLLCRQVNTDATMCRTHLALFVTVAMVHSTIAGILYGTGAMPNNRDWGMGPASAIIVNDDEWEPVYRIYEGQDWDSHDDYLSKERSARDGDKDDSQFRSWRLDQWNNNKVHKVRVELYDDGDEVAEFEFEGTMQNLTSFFSPRNLRRTTYDDIPDGHSPRTFTGDDFSFDGDDDSRHWAVSSRHIGDCRNDEGWIQVIDKPKPGRDRCVCSYENVDDYPTIMYAKGNRRARWSDKANVGHADMMQISISHVPYPPRPTPPAPPIQPVRQPRPVQQMKRTPQRAQFQIFPFETKK